MLCCAASDLIAAYFYGRLIPHDFFASCKDAQSQPFGSGPGLRALPANFLRNHQNFELFTSPSKLISGIPAKAGFQEI
jgi:hypothetical protein